MNLDIHNLTIPEKLQAMEMLWDDICRNVSDFPSPDWHGKLLRNREKELEQNDDSFMDWNQAKNDIRKNIS